MGDGTDGDLESVRGRIPSRGYLLSILLLILAFNYVDRLAFGLLLQPIKEDLALSDAQMGLLTGIAFAAFYAVMGIPIARWADRGNRVTIITVTTALWSAAVMLCGYVQSFTQLLVARALVAVGEAGCIPPAHSLIADHYERAERPRAMAIYMQGATLSVVFGYFGAGWLNEAIGWRVTFIVLGLPGLLLALIAWWSLKDPRTARVSQPHSLTPEPAHFLSDVRELWGIPAYRHLTLFFSTSWLFGTGLVLWQPAFFSRSYGFSTGELGTWFAIVYGVCGFLGTWLGGEWASRRLAQNESGQLRMMGVTYGFLALFSCGIYLARSPYLSFLMMGLLALGTGIITGPVFACLQTLVPGRLRATAVAAIYLTGNLIGMGLGPLLAGALSDALSPSWGSDSLRFALLLLSPGYLWAAAHLLLAGKAISLASDAAD